jgi:hypothetical protein
VVLVDRAVEVRTMITCILAALAVLMLAMFAGRNARPGAEVKHIDVCKTCATASTVIWKAIDDMKALPGMRAQLANIGDTSSSYTLGYGPWWENMKPEED